jgi:hypothetical protein
LLARDATELGWSWDHFHRLVLAEGWTRPFRGAYFAPDTPDNAITRTRAIQLLRPGVVASHELAAYLHGFALAREPRLEFTNRGKGRPDIPGGHLYRWLLDDREVVNVGGILATDPLRTAIDLMRRRDRDAAVIAVDSALRQGRLGLDAIADQLQRLGGEPGIRHAWKAFVCLDPKADSPTESKVRLIMWDRKIYPQTQVHLIGADGRSYYADFVVRGCVFEAEGFAYHGGKDEHEGDVVRFNALANAARHGGLDFARVTYAKAFAEPRQTGDLIVRTIAARQRRLGRPLTTGERPGGGSPVARGAAR